jgi:hypothetical protein
MDRQIDFYLAYVANRFRRVRFAWLLSGLWIALAIWILVGVSTSPNPTRLFPWLWIVSMAGAVCLWFVNRLSFRQPLQIATEIEEKFPDLKQRLLTAVEPNLKDSSPFLRRQLIDETIQHARSNDWGNAVPSSRMLGAWCVQTLCLLLPFGASLLASASLSNPSSSGTDLIGDSKSQNGISVEPGDVEVERGTDVVVSARFAGPLPERTWLVVSDSLDPNRAGKEGTTGSKNGELTTDEKQSGRMAMNRALSDPVFGAYLRRVGSELTYHVESDLGKSDEYRVRVFDYPALVRSDAHIAPPEYAKQESKVVEDTRRVSVAEGTGLKWTCFVNKPLATADLIDDKGEVVPLTPSSEDPLRMEASFVIDESKQWTIRLTDRDNRSAKFDEKLAAKVIRNKEPEIKLAKAQDVRVSPLQEMSLQATVRDDFEVKKAGITLVLGDNEPLESELESKPSKAGKQEVSHLVDLESMKAEPDQLLSYFFWAEDLDREGNPRRVEGDMFFAEVRPFEEIFREGESQSPSEQQQQQQQQQSPAGQKAEELAELQKQIISGTWNILRRETTKTLSKSFADDINVLKESQSGALEQTAEMEEKIQDDRSAAYFKELQSAMQTAVTLLDQSRTEESLKVLREALNAERKAYEGLLKLRAREHSIVKSQRNQQSKSKSSAQQNRQEQLEQLKLENEENKYESEQKAQAEESTPERESRQVMNRLEELARRQKDLNEQLKSLENSIREAKTEEQKKDLEEQLARLRENQEEMVRDADELLERMNQEENRQAMQESREQVEQARDQLQESSQSLSQGDPSKALSSGTRAQRQMDETREKMRQESSNQMQETMRDMVQQAKQLEAEQSKLEEKIRRNDPNNEPTAADDRNDSSVSKALEEDASATPLRPEGTETSPNDVQQAWKNQKQKMNELLEEMQETVTEAESSEPLLAEQLYETFRETKQRGIDKQLDQIPLLLNRGMEKPAEQIAQEAGKGITKLREGVEKASTNVLGNEQESLRRALREIDKARDQLNQEMSSKNPGGEEPQQGNQAGNQPQGDEQKPRESKQPGGEQQPPEGQQPGDRRQPGEGQQPGERQQGEGQQAGEGQQPSGSQPSETQPRGESQPRGDGDLGSRTSGQERSARRGLTTNEGRISAAPLTGEEYRNWTDSLRDIEELVTDQDMKAEVARVREAAREMRVEYKRHSKEPQWSLVQKMIAEPLSRLREQVNEELLKKAAARNSLVPIDRDPVPSSFQRQLDRYYENLGSGSRR